jgi:hypothetical protein
VRAVETHGAPCARSATSNAPDLRIRAAVTGIVAMGLAFRLWGVTWGLQNATVSRRPHPDEWTIYWLFRWFGQTRSLNPCPRYPGHCFFDWGSAFPYLAYALHFALAPFIALLPAGAFGPQADPGFVHAILAARIVSALVSTATIYVAYRFGALAFGPRTGILAALLVALSGLLIQLGHFATPDSTTLLALSLALLAIYRSALEQTNRRVLAAGAMVGIAAGAEYHMVLLAIPLVAAWRLSGGRDVAKLALAAGAGALCFLFLNPYLVPDFPGFVAAVEHTLRIRTIDSGLQYGDRWLPYSPSWLYVVRYPLGYGVGFAVAAWMLFGFGWAVIRRTRADVILLAWLLPYFVLVTLEPAKFMRYSAPLLVPLALLAGRSAVEVMGRLSPLGKASLLGLAGAAIAFTATYDAAYAGIFSATDSRSQAIAWVNAHARSGQTVAFEELPDGILTMPYFLRSGVRACFLQERASRFASADYVLLDSFTREELTVRATARNDRMIAVLAASPSFRQVAVIDNEPTALGLGFSIAASPHDWRYPAHRVVIYRRVSGSAISSPFCFRSLRMAAQVLYVSPSQRT